MSAQRVPTAAAAAALFVLGAFIASGGCTRKAECASDDDCGAGAYCLLPEGYCFGRDGAVADAGADAGSGDDDAGEGQGDGGRDAGSEPEEQQPFCNEDRWCWVNPLPTAGWILGVDGVAADEAWAVGWGLPILRWNGRAWLASHEHDGGRLTDVVAVRRGLAFTVGAFGEILRWDGSRWSSESSGTASNLARLFALSESAVWAAGEDGTVVHFDGQKWQVEPTSTQDEIRTLWRAKDGSLRALSVSGELLGRSAQGVWTVIDSGLPTAVLDTCAFPEGDGWAVTGNGAIWAMAADGGWELKLQTPKPVTSLACVARNDVWAGTFGGFLRWNGSEWGAAGQLDELDRVHAIWREGDVGLAVGAYGLTQRWTQTGWAPHSKDVFSRQTLTSSWTSGDALYVGLDRDGRIYRCTFEGSCLLVRSRGFGGGIYSISGTSPTSVWAGGDLELAHWNGTTWTTTTRARTTMKVHASRAPDGGERVWIVSAEQAGSSETVVERCDTDGSTPDCSPVDTGVVGPVDVWSDGDRLWVASGTGALSICSAELDCVVTDAGTPFKALTGMPGPSVVAIATSGRISTWKNSWSHEQVPGAGDLVAVSATSNERFWVLDDEGNVFRHVPEEAWHRAFVPDDASSALQTLTVVSPSNIWAGGRYGMLLRYQP